MLDYKAVPSGLEISRHVVDCLEAEASACYQLEERAHAIRAVNDILQGRASRTVGELLAELELCGGEKIAAVRQEIRDFQRQKELLSASYSGGSTKQFLCKRRKEGGKSLKVIGQNIYDRAAKAGFPLDFFRESYFDNVTFYCLPECADFYASELRNCRFAVCRMEHPTFIGAHIYDTMFYSCILNRADFFGATVAHTRINDCELSHAMLQKTHMAHCSFTVCTLDHVNFLGTLLDGCTFSQITAGEIKNLDKATISLGGATEDECRHNKAAIYHALGVTGVAA